MHTLYSVLSLALAASAIQWYLNSSVFQGTLFSGTVESDLLYTATGPTLVSSLSFRGSYPVLAFQQPTLPTLPSSTEVSTTSAPSSTQPSPTPIPAPCSTPFGCTPQNGCTVEPNCDDTRECQIAGNLAECATNPFGECEAHCIEPFCVGLELYEVGGGAQCTVFNQLVNLRDQQCTLAGYGQYQSIYLNITSFGGLSGVSYEIAPCLDASCGNCASPINFIPNDCNNALNSFYAIATAPQRCDLSPCGDDGYGCYDNEEIITSWDSAFPTTINFPSPECPSTRDCLTSGGQPQCDVDGTGVCNHLCAALYDCDSDGQSCLDSESTPIFYGPLGECLSLLDVNGQGFASPEPNARITLVDEYVQLEFSDGYCANYAPPIYTQIGLPFSTPGGYYQVQVDNCDRTSICGDDGYGCRTENITDLFATPLAELTYYPQEFCIATKECIANGGAPQCRPEGGITTIGQGTCLYDLCFALLSQTTAERLAYGPINTCIENTAALGSVDSFIVTYLGNIIRVDGYSGKACNQFLQTFILQQDQLQGILGGNVSIETCDPCADAFGCISDTPDYNCPATGACIGNGGTPDCSTGTCFIPGPSPLPDQLRARQQPVNCTLGVALVLSHFNPSIQLVDGQPLVLPLAAVIDAWVTELTSLDIDPQTTPVFEYDSHDDKGWQGIKLNDGESIELLSTLECSGETTISYSGQLTWE